eukprot:gnl/TRDRNA2_/TRDRNA2_184087_c0_seq1.p1 gnl/TRDRNA2_/TRDRNA2_184087_c0~~gnl/TRDRNA2_/TRDRNA2_184087_c0_seq1.p1  ORF type:complete len:347 (-),score=72.65 gnl/TRDRNA2_/TRDRNA2_184087_c0_seq1:158-1198(-)
MGCSSSKKKGGAGQPLKSNDAQKQPPPSTAKRKLDPKDFVLSKLVGQTITKEEGTIMGEQFNIEECQDCDIFLCDHIATCFMDDCTGCRVFIGPVESSVFLRGCRNCDFVIACQQFRSRDCHNCRLSLLSTTEPIIETSLNMQFACFDFFYFSLRQHLSRAGLKVWNNKWWQVHDFNKNADNPNWTLLPQEQVQSLLRVGQCSSITPEELEMERVVPVTLGSRPWPSQESCLVIFLPDSDALVEAFIGKAQRTPEWFLCRTRETALPEFRLKSLFVGASNLKEMLSRCKGKEVTGVEVCGDRVYQQVEQAIATSGLATGSKSIFIVPEKEGAILAKAFFEMWKDEI